MLNTSQKYLGIIILIVVSILAAQPAYKLDTQEGRVPGKMVNGFALKPNAENNNLFDQLFNDETVETGYTYRYSYSRDNRSVDDTLYYDLPWNAYFYMSPGDVMVTAFQMPTDATLKGVNVPVYRWGTGEELTVSVHALSYPYGSDGVMYDQGLVNGSGWLAGYDDNNDGHMELEGTTWDTETGFCSAGMMISNATDPLGSTAASSGPPNTPTMGLLWPDGSTAATLNPTDNPGIENGGGDNWVSFTAYGSEVDVSSGDWIGVVVHYTGTGGDGSDPGIGFQYAAYDGISPWRSFKFYEAACGGTGGENGWYIRGWAFNYQLAVELTGDRGPVFESISELPTTISEDARTVNCTVSDDNPSGGDAGVAAVTLSYQLNDLTADTNTVSMTDNGDGTWTGDIPGQAPGTFVYWSLEATDVGGLTTSSNTMSYFIFQVTAGNDLIFNNQDALYGSLIYSSYLYFYWGGTGFDIWDASYGPLSNELLEYYDVLIELCGTGPVYINDDEISAWWNVDKTYIVAGDEWLGLRTGWYNSTYGPGDLPYDVLGIAADYNNVNYGASGDQYGVSRLMAGADGFASSLAGFVADSLDVNYNPGYETGGSNWLDGVDPADGYTVDMTAYGGVLDGDGNVTDSTVYNVMIHGVINGKSAFLAFDAIALNTVPSYYWVGASHYYNYNGYANPADASPLIQAYESLAADTVVITYSIFNVTSENIIHGDTGMVDVNAIFYQELSSIDLSFSGFQGNLEFLEIVADSSSLMGSLDWLIQANNTDSLLITASIGSQNITSSGKLFSLKFAVPDTLASQYVPINLVDFLGNTDLINYSTTNGGVQVVWGPTIGFTSTETLGDYPLTVTFTDTSNAGTFPITTWSWDFGDDSTASGQTAEHTYSLPGIYDVSLNIADEFGLTDTLVYQGLVQLDTVYGDVDWNTAVQSYDGSLILKDLAEMIELDTLQRIVGDVSGDSSLSTLDATLILQYVVGLITELPYDPGTQFLATGDLSMEDHGVAPGSVAAVPINITSGSNIYGFEAVLEFDPAVLEFDTLLLSETMANYLIYTNPLEEGVVKVVASGSNVDGNEGIFATLYFNVSNDFTDATVIQINNLRWNEGEVVENAAEMTLSYALGIGEELLPDVYALHQNYPNPFNPITTLRYDLPEQATVNIIIYDMLGRQVRTLLNQTQDAGYRSVIWNATNDYGKPVSAGVYLYKIQAGEFVQTKKMVLLK